MNALRMIIRMCKRRLTSSVQ